MNDLTIQIWLLASAAFLIYATLYAICQVGRPREPFKANDAAAGTVVFAAIIVVLVIAAVKL